MEFAKQTIINEKESLKMMDIKEKAFYYASQKRTWITIGAVITAVIQKDYITAVTQFFTIWG